MSVGRNLGICKWHTDSERFYNEETFLENDESMDSRSLFIIAFVLRPRVLLTSVFKAIIRQDVRIFNVSAHQNIHICLRSSWTNGDSILTVKVLFQFSYKLIAFLVYLTIRE